VKTLTTALGEIFSSTEVDFPFKDVKSTIGDKSVDGKPGVLLTGDGVGSKSGIYLITTTEDEVIYIGKATKNNLHHRVWGHLKTPSQLENGNWSFQKNEFESFGTEINHVKNVRSGNVKLGIITISSPELVSLVEVYLHTLHVQKYSKLPFFNKQIG
jgi:hypothetical protein